MPSDAEEVWEELSPEDVHALPLWQRPEWSRGAHSVHPSMRRRDRLTLYLRPCDREDLALIAEAWSERVATVGWALLGDALERLRTQNGGTDGKALPIAFLKRLAPHVDRMRAEEEAKRKREGK